jgi:Protein of unknown function (DUF1559)
MRTLSDSGIGSSPSGSAERCKSRLFARFAVAIACVLLAAAALVWQSMRQRAANTLACMDHVKKIVLALHAYHDALGTFPPPHFVDRTGRPIHSWRVLVLPFLGEQSLYDKYRFDEPWDGPHNRELASQTPAVFHCPADLGDPANTSYLVVIGDGTVFPPKYCRRITDVLDGPSNTILFVESTGSGVNWMEPRDLTYDQALAGINPRGSAGLSSRHGNFAVVATVDGSIWMLPESVSRDTLRKLLLCNDGEAIPELGRPQDSAIEAPKTPDIGPEAERMVK